MVTMQMTRLGSELLVSGFCKLLDAPNMAKVDNGADWSSDPDLDEGDEGSV